MLKKLHGYVLGQTFLSMLFPHCDGARISQFATVSLDVTESHGQEVFKRNDTAERFGGFSEFCS